MELHQARYFLAVCEARNFTRAAKRCNVSQPALTSAIKKLEKELDGPLFYRDRSGAKLTTLGERLYPRFQRLVRESQSIAELAGEHSRLQSVPVRVGVLTTIGPTRIARFLEAFSRAAPAVEVEFHVETHDRLRARVEEAELEVAITNVTKPADWMVIKELYSEPYVVVLPPGHRLERHGAVPLAELAGERYIDRTACELREMVNQVCDQRGVELYACYRTEREGWIECLVRAGIGFAFLPQYSVISTDTCIRHLADPTISRHISLMRCVDHPMSPAARLFWDTLLAQAQTQPALMDP